MLMFASANVEIIICQCKLFFEFFLPVANRFLGKFTGLILYASENESCLWFLSNDKC